MNATQIEVNQLRDGFEFVLESVKKATIAGMFENNNPEIPIDGEIRVYSVYGNSAGAFGVRATHFGQLQRSFHLSKGGVAIGYLILTKYDNWIEVEQHTTSNHLAGITFDALLNLLREADKTIANSNVAHLFNCPFPIKGQFEMGPSIHVIE